MKCIHLRRPKFQSLTLTSILIAASAFFSFAEDADLIRLRQSYNDARDRVLAPVNATYEKELSKLLDKQMKAGKLDEAVKTQKELDSLKFQVKASSGDSDKQEQPGIERFFIGKNWESPLGTIFQLKRNGSGIKIKGSSVSQVTWEKVTSDVIKVNGQKESNGLVPTWYLKFVTEEEAYIGASSANTNEKLKLK